MKKLLSVFWFWLPIATGATVIWAFAFGAIQQNYRQSANDPQIQLVEDGQSALASGKQPAEVVGRGEIIDISKSLAPFVAVYDQNGNPLESSGKIENELPRPPVGVFEYAKKEGENRLTWQPNKTTRIALMVRPVGINSGWFIVAGRNLREIEIREKKLTEMAFFALIASLIISFAASYLVKSMQGKKIG